MTGDVQTIIDFAGSLAVIAMLAMAYASIRRRILDPRMAETVLGLLFGFVAVVQMNSPFEPIDGMLIDLRNVPIVLAGAFLGLRGSIACIALAAAARMQIGGVGAAAGIVAMVVSGGAGAVWTLLTANRRTGVWPLLGLGALTCLNFGAVVMLPPGLAVWYLTRVAPAMTVLHLVVIPVFAHLILRERDRIAEEERTRGAAQERGDEVVPQAALRWALVHSSTVGSLRGPVDCMGLKLRHHGLIGWLWGSDALRRSAGAMGARVADLVPAGGLVGWAGPDLMLVVVPRLGEAERADLVREIPAVAAGPALGRSGMFRLAVDVRALAYAPLPPLERIVADMTRSDRGAAGPAAAGPMPDRQRRRAAPPAPKPAAGADPKAPDLFATFDVLREARTAPS